LKKTFILFLIGLFIFQFTRGQNFVLPSVISPVAEKEDWPVLRARIRDKILKTWGKCPVSFMPEKNEFKEVSRYKKNGLTFIVYKYHVLDNSWDRGILVLPEGFDKDKKYPLVMPIHGTNYNAGADGMLDWDIHSHRAYGLELAQQGYITFCPDHFGFGDYLKDESQETVYNRFEREYPGWSITGRQILGFIRAIDLIYQLPCVDTEKGIGVIGNSLGGKSSLYVTAFDDRISVAVISTGISPMISNTYRGLDSMRREQPFYWDVVQKNVKYIWDYNEMIALCAPRALLFIEPTNDPYNPFIEVSLQAVLSALPVWKLYNNPEKLNFLMHGDGHDTTDPVRDIAYKWFDRFL